MAAELQAARIKDLAAFRGVRANQLVGYGLVVGLTGSGDSDDAKFMLQSLSSMLEKMGVTVKPEDIEVKNVAAVIVTAELPPFARMGSRLDILVNSLGNAKSLQGGTLLMTPLKGADGQVYVVAQGPISTGGFTVGANTGDKVQKNFTTVGRVVQGGFVEREVPFNLNHKESLSLALHRPDFTTATRMAQAINAGLEANVCACPGLRHGAGGGPAEIPGGPRPADRRHREPERDPRQRLAHRDQRAHRDGDHGRERADLDRGHRPRQPERRDQDQFQRLPAAALFAHRGDRRHPGHPDHGPGGAGAALCHAGRRQHRRSRPGAQRARGHPARPDLDLSGA
jgi:hypothetical protein